MQASICAIDTGKRLRMVKINHLIYTAVIGILTIQVALYAYADNEHSKAAEVTKTTQQLGLVKSTDNTASPGATPSQQSSTVPSPTPTVEQAKVIETAAQWQRNMAAHSQALPGRLISEPRDPNWARPLEQRIRDSFFQNEQLRAYELARVQCRSQLCAISITVDSDASVEFMSEITAIVRQQDWYQAFQHMVFHGDRNSANQITLFLE